MLAGLVRLAHPAEDPGETEMAVGSDRPHPELLGERERITVVAFRVPRWVAAGGGVTKEPERACLVASLTALAGERQGSFRVLVRVLQPAGQDVCLSQIAEEQREEIAVSPGLGGAEGVLHQWDALGDPPRTRMDVAQRSRLVRQERRQIPLARHRQPTLEQRKRETEVSSGDMQVSEDPAREGQAIKVRL